MDAFTVYPLAGVGPVGLGMSRQQVREALGVPVTEFRKTLSDACLTDAFLDSTFQVFYDKDDRAEFIELSRGGPVAVLWEGVSVFEERADDLAVRVSQVADLDPDQPEQGYAFVFPKLELSLWRQCMPEAGEDADEEDEELGAYFDTIGVGRRGYFGRGAA